MAGVAILAQPIKMALTTNLLKRVARDGAAYSKEEFKAKIMTKGHVHLFIYNTDSACRHLVFACVDQIGANVRVNARRRENIIAIVITYHRSIKPDLRSSES